MADTRSRYQQMAAEGLIDFDELRALGGREGERTDTEAALGAIQGAQSVLSAFRETATPSLKSTAPSCPRSLRGSHKRSATGCTRSCAWL